MNTWVGGWGFCGFPPGHEPSLQGTQSPEELEDDVLFTKGILQPSKHCNMLPCLA